MISIVLPSSMVMRFRSFRLDAWMLVLPAARPAPFGDSHQPIADRQQPEVEALPRWRPTGRAAAAARTAAAVAPSPIRYQTPAAAEPGLDQEEDQRAEDGALEAADAADQHHEDHVGGPLHAEIGLGLEGHRGGQPQRAGHADAEGGEHEQQPLGADDAHADRGGGVLIVADRLDGGADAAAQQHEQRAEQCGHRGQRQPVDQFAARAGCHRR